MSRVHLETVLYRDNVYEEELIQLISDDEQSTAGATRVPGSLPLQVTSPRS